MLATPWLCTSGDSHYRFIDHIEIERATFGSVGYCDNSLVYRELVIMRWIDSVPNSLSSFRFPYNHLSRGCSSCYSPSISELYDMKWSEGRALCGLHPT